MQVRDRYTKEIREETLSELHSRLCYQQAGYRRVRQFWLDSYRYWREHAEDNDGVDRSSEFMRLNALRKALEACKNYNAHGHAPLLY